MKVIIDILEDVYTRLFDNGIQDNEIAVDDVCEMARAIRKGTPLPKGHGAIIDIKKLEEFWKEHEIGHSAFNGELLYDAGRTSRHDVIWKPLLDVLPTIIEADKEG